MIFGITGGSGCGKTTLLNLIARCGGVILDCDTIYHSLLQTDAQLLSAIEAAFPGTVEDGTLQRKKLGAIVFADPRKLDTLNRITHAAVKAEVVRRLEEKPSLAAIDAIALFEGGLAELCDVTVAVTAPREDRILRLLQRDGISRQYATSRIDAQQPDRYFVELCDHVLANDSTLEAFQGKCLAFLQSFGIMEP